MLEKGNNRTICSLSYSEHPSPSALFSWLLSSAPRRTQPEGAGTVVMSLGLFFFSLHPPCCCRISCDPSEVSEASSGFILVIQSSRRSALPFERSRCGVGPPAWDRKGGIGITGAKSGAQENQRFQFILMYKQEGTASTGAGGKLPVRNILSLLLCITPLS